MNAKVKNKKIKNNDSADRLIARMLLVAGLSLTVASSVYCAKLHPQIGGLRDDYHTALSQKEAYLDDYEKRDEFKNQYYFDTAALNERLIAREINGETYDKQLKYMESNDYTEKVVMQTASEQMKKTYNKLNQQYLDSKQKFDATSLPYLLSVYGTLGFPFIGLGCYHIWNPKKKKRHLDFEVDAPKSHISKESIKRVMELEDVPYQGDDYIPHSKGSEDTQKYMPFYDEKYGVIRMLNNEDIEEAETQENENIL